MNLSKIKTSGTGLALFMAALGAHVPEQALADVSLLPSGDVSVPIGEQLLFGQGTTSGNTAPFLFEAQLFGFAEVKDSAPADSGLTTKIRVSGTGSIQAAGALELLLDCHETTGIFTAPDGTTKAFVTKAIIECDSTHTAMGSVNAKAVTE